MMKMKATAARALSALAFLLLGLGAPLASDDGMVIPRRSAFDTACVVIVDNDGAQGFTELYSRFIRRDYDESILFAPEEYDGSQRIKEDIQRISSELFFHVPLIDRSGRRSALENQLRELSQRNSDAKRSHRDGFERELTELLRRRNAVDIYVFSHGNKKYEYLDGIPPELKQKIRLVYNAGCGNAADAQAWLSRGPAAYVGHRGTSYSWIFLHEFKDAWLNGHPLSQAVWIGNQYLARNIWVTDWFHDDFLPETEEGRKKRLKEYVKGSEAIAFGKTHLTVRHKRNPRSRSSADTAATPAPTPASPGSPRPSAGLGVDIRGPQFP